VFSKRVRRELYHQKIGSNRWLEIHEIAHRMGIPSNSTLHYGHIETKAERVQHMILLRELEARAPGFFAFIPLAFQPGTTGLVRRQASAIDDLKTGAGVHLKKGVRLEAAGQLEAAAEEHERSLAADPKFLQAHINLISLYARLGLSDKAEQHYRAAVSINPNIAEIHYDCGVLLTGQQKYAEAQEAFRRALEINPNYAEAHNNYAYLLMISGKLEEAARHYQAAIDNKPNNRAAKFNLGRILVHQAKLQEAIALFLQTLTPEDEDTPRFMYALAAAYARAGNRQDALKYMRDARQRAEALGQSELLSSIEKDLRLLEKGVGPP